ncbi:MAG: hypothetical protein HON91_05880 [Anaerolineae bacterium]|jgi:enterochelin esterase-like enzyme|nr:hypothetical protein [Anaerolineae bacterium]
MDKRQALIFSFWIGALFSWISACTPLSTPTPTPTQIPIKYATPTLSVPILAEPSPTPESCIGTRGQVEKIAFDSPALPHFYIYLPECYALDDETDYPVLYLLHGQGYEADQWLRLGMAERAAALMAAEEISPFLIVMPYDKASWRGVDDDQFGEVFVNKLIPYIDENYRTIAKRESRAVGGLSRGAGWAIRYGLKRWGLFGALGAHSPAIFYRDYKKLDDWIAEIPDKYLPQIYIDIGDLDGERGDATNFSELLAEENVIHEWHLYSGAHEESYWQAHIDDYLHWYGCFLGCSLEIETP